MRWPMVIVGLVVLVVWWGLSVTPVQASDVFSPVGSRMGGVSGGDLGLATGACGWPEGGGWWRRPERPRPPPEPWHPLRRRRRSSMAGDRRKRPGRHRRKGHTGFGSSGSQVSGRPTSEQARGVTPSWVVPEIPVAQAPSPGPEATAVLPVKAWVAQELAEVRLGDVRLERRLHILVSQLAEQPTASIPQACGTWASTKAAYRFFDNPKVSHRDILTGHRLACLDRVAPEGLALVLQDTTSLDYTHHPQTKGLGRLEKAECQGLFVHSSMAVSEAGVPLGLLDQQVWARDPETVGQRHQRKKRPIEEKESYKWLKGLRATLKGLPDRVCVVTVADREADIFDFFLEAENLSTQVLVRAAWDRRLADSSDYLWEAVARTPVRGRYTVEVGRAKDRLPRQATVIVRYTSVRLRPPRHRLHEPGLHPLPLYVIEVREENPPPGEEPLHWLLLTNRPVSSLAQAQRYVRWYALRWLVERYHFVLKSGCKIEDRQLETGDRLQRCLGVYAIVAWRLLWLTYQARITPQAPCTLALETHEWRALYGYIHRTSTPPAEPPSLDQAVRWIAQLGGFLGRKHDGEPGVKVLWRGWQRLHDIAETWQLTHPPPDVGNA